MYLKYYEVIGWLMYLTIVLDLIMPTQLIVPSVEHLKAFERPYRYWICLEYYNKLVFDSWMNVCDLRILIWYSTFDFTSIIEG